MNINVHVSRYMLCTSFPPYTQRRKRERDSTLPLLKYGCVPLCKFIICLLISFYRVLFLKMMKSYIIVVREKKPNTLQTLNTRYGICWIYLVFLLFFLSICKILFKRLPKHGQISRKCCFLWGMCSVEWQSRKSSTSKSLFFFHFNTWCFICTFYCCHSTFFPVLFSLKKTT